MFHLATILVMISLIHCIPILSTQWILLHQLHNFLPFFPRKELFWQQAWPNFKSTLMYKRGHVCRNVTREIFPPRISHEILRNLIHQLRVNDWICQFSCTPTILIQSSKPLHNPLRQENETPIYKIDNWNKGYEIDEKTKFTINLIDNTVFADFDKGEDLCRGWTG